MHAEEYIFDTMSLALKDTRFFLYNNFANYSKGKIYNIDINKLGGIFLETIYLTFHRN